jgi:hypothetical protein
MNENRIMKTIVLKWTVGRDKKSNRGGEFDHMHVCKYLNENPLYDSHMLIFLKATTLRFYLLSQEWQPRRKQQPLFSMWEKRNPYTLLVRICINELWKLTWKLLKKRKIKLPYDFYTTLGHITLTKISHTMEIPSHPCLLQTYSQWPS